MKEFFLRCDDVTAPDRAFLAVYRLFAKAALPLSCAVIPASAGKPLSDFFRAQAAVGARLEALQHGFSHAEHAGNRHLKHEFGPSRTYEVQKADIAAGKKLMRRLFGRFFRPVFVPPFHALNSDTLRALGALKFCAVSASRLPPGPAPRGLAFLRTRVTVNEYDLQRRPRRLDLGELKARTVAALKEEGPAGIYFHHDAIKGDGLAAFAAYIRFLVGLREKGLADFRLASELLKKPGR